MIKYLLLLMFIFSQSVSAKTLTIVYPWIDSRPAINARILGKYLQKHLKDVTRVKFKHIPGANGIVAANYLYSYSSKNEYIIGTFNRNIPLLGITGGENIKFDSMKFEWVGSSDDGRKDMMILLSHKNYVDNLIIGSSNVELFDSSVFIRKHLKWNIKHVAGYKGNNDLRLAFERNEIDAFFININSILGTKADWLSEYKVLFQFGNMNNRHERLLTIPTLYDIIENKKMLSFFEKQFILLRPYATPPNIDIYILDELRIAFDKAMKDEEYLIETSNVAIPVNYIDFIEIQKILNEMKEEYNVIQKHQ